MAIQEQQQEQQAQPLDPELESMIQAGVHFGHKTSKTHPRMLPYVAGIRNTVHVINIEKTREKLQQTIAYLQELRKEDKVVVLVGTKIQMRQFVKEAAEACGFSYVTERWIGGTFTNFGSIRGRIEYLEELENRKRSEEWAKYTKKEQAGMEKEMQDLKMKFGGIRTLDRLPDAIFLFDLNENELAAKEAKQMGVSVIAIADTDANPDNADYIVPANDDAVSSIRYILDRIVEQCGKGAVQHPQSQSVSQDNESASAKQEDDAKNDEA